MSETIKSMELDRKLAEDSGNKSIYRADKVLVGPKNISLTSFHHEMPQSIGQPYIHKTRMTFKKICGSSDDHIELQVEKFEKRHRATQCNLGHTHHTEKYEFSTWARMCFSWDDFEQLLEWFQNGRFYDPRTRQARQKKSKDGLHSKERL